MFLFGSTMRANIAYGRLGAGDAEILDAAARAQLLPMIETLPEGLDTAVGERGVMLSGGCQSQRVIARAFLKKPAAADPGRGDPRPWISGNRTRDSGRAEGACGRAHDAGHRPPPRHDPQRRPDRGDGSGPRVRGPAAIPA
ncbi:hypothetical protein PE067_14085 [Paracoccus sp. DMF-8]|uniref:hypothetical protein n=1 Tax=Paracoccus sp. DMF-8 TaxID=3019445 RepID=UPI0023E82A9E|nr:hypothetical protein [Paracoccus sp. DMF-8]MDF3607165.1 hypothetical protein [Paracoccus sp. DMF-8]